MSACLRHVETIVRDLFFFINFTFKCSEEGPVKENFAQSSIPLFMVSTMAKIVAPYLNWFVSYNRFCRRL